MSFAGFDDGPGGTGGALPPVDDRPVFGPPAPEDTGPTPQRPESEATANRADDTAAAPPDPAPQRPEPEAIARHADAPAPVDDRPVFLPDAPAAAGTGPVDDRPVFLPDGDGGPVQEHAGGENPSLTQLDLAGRGLTDARDSVEGWANDATARAAALQHEQASLDGEYADLKSRMDQGFRTQQEVDDFRAAADDYDRRREDFRRRAVEMATQVEFEGRVLGGENRAADQQYGETLATARQAATDYGAIAEQANVEGRANQAEAFAADTGLADQVANEQEATRRAAATEALAADAQNAAPSGDAADAQYRQLVEEDAANRSPQGSGLAAGPSLPGDTTEIALAAQRPDVLGFVKPSDGGAWQPFTADDAARVQAGVGDGSLRAVPKSEANAIAIDQVRPGGLDPVSPERVAAVAGTAVLAMGALIEAPTAARLYGAYQTVRSAGDVLADIRDRRWSMAAQDAAATVISGLSMGFLGKIAETGVGIIAGDAPTDLIKVGAKSAVAAFVMNGLPDFVPGPAAIHVPGGLIMEGVNYITRGFLDGSIPKNIADNLLNTGGPVDFRSLPNLMEAVFSLSPEDYFRAQGLQRLFHADPGVGLPGIRTAGGPIASWQVQVATAILGVAVSDLQAAAMNRGYSIVEHLDPWLAFDRGYADGLARGLSPQQASDEQVHGRVSGLAEFLWATDPFNPVNSWLGLPGLGHAADDVLSRYESKRIPTDALLNGTPMADLYRGPLGGYGVRQFFNGLTKEAALAKFGREVAQLLQGKISAGDLATPQVADLLNLSRNLAKGIWLDEQATAARRAGDNARATDLWDKADIANEEAQRLAELVGVDRLGNPLTSQADIPTAWTSVMGKDARGALGRMMDGAPVGGPPNAPFDTAAIDRYYAARRNRLGDATTGAVAEKRRAIPDPSVRRDAAAARLVAIDEIAGHIQDNARMQLGMRTSQWAASDPNAIIAGAAQALTMLRTAMLVVAAPGIAAKRATSELQNVSSAAGEILPPRLADLAIVQRRDNGRGPARSAIGRQVTETGIVSPRLEVPPVYAPPVRVEYVDGVRVERPAALPARIAGRVGEVGDALLRHTISDPQRHEIAAGIAHGLDALGPAATAHFEALARDLRATGLPEARVQELLADVRTPGAKRLADYNAAHDRLVAALDAARPGKAAYDRLLAQWAAATDAHLAASKLVPKSAPDPKLAARVAAARAALNAVPVPTPFSPAEQAMIQASRDAMQEHGERWEDTVAGVHADAERLIQRSVGNYGDTAPIATVAHLLLPFAEFHFNATRVGIARMVENPFYAYNMVRYLADNEDQFRRVPLIGDLVANLVNLSTTVHTADFFRHYADYIRLAIADDGNDPRQKVERIVGHGLVGPDALVQSFPWADQPGRALLDRTSHPVHGDDGKPVFGDAGKAPTTDNGPVGLIRYGADRLLDGTARDAVRGLAPYVGNPAGVGMDRARGLLGGATAQPADLEKRLPFDAVDLGRALGWDRKRTSAAVGDPTSPDGIALRHAQQAAYDKDLIARNAPIQISRVAPADDPAKQNYFRNYAISRAIAARRAEETQGNNLAKLTNRRVLSELYDARRTLADDPASPIFAPPGPTHSAPEREKVFPGQYAASRRSDMDTLMAQDPLSPASLDWQRTIQDRKQYGFESAYHVSREHAMDAVLDPASGQAARIAHNNEVQVAESGLLLARREMQTAIYGRDPDAIAAAAQKVHYAEDDLRALHGSTAPTAGLQGLDRAPTTPQGTPQVALDRDGKPNRFGAPVAENANPGAAVAADRYVDRQLVKADPYGLATQAHLDALREAGKTGLVTRLDPYLAKNATEHQTENQYELSKAQETESDIANFRFLSPEDRLAALDYKQAGMAYRGVEMTDPGTGREVRVGDYLNTSGYYDLKGELAKAIEAKDRAAQAAIRGRIGQIEAVPAVRDYLAAVAAADKRDQWGRIQNRRDDALLNPETRRALAPLDHVQPAYRAGDEVVQPGVFARPDSTAAAPDLRYGGAPTPRDPSSYGARFSREYYDAFSDGQRAAYDGRTALEQDDRVKRYNELVQQLMDLGGYKTAEGKRFFLANQAEWNADRAYYRDGLARIRAETGEDPLAVTNQMHLATGGAPLGAASMDDLSAPGGGKGLRPHGKGWVDYPVSPKKAEFDRWNGDQQQAFKDYVGVMGSDAAKGYFGQIAEWQAAGGYGTPGGDAWMKANGDAYRRAKQSYVDALVEIRSRTGVDPLVVANEMRAAGGKPPLSHATLDDLLAGGARSTQWQSDILAALGEITGVGTGDPFHVAAYDKHTAALDWERFYGTLSPWEKSLLIKDGLKPATPGDATAEGIAAARAALDGGMATASAGIANRFDPHNAYQDGRTHMSIDRAVMTPEERLLAALSGDATAHGPRPWSGMSPAGHGGGQSSGKKPAPYHTKKPKQAKRTTALPKGFLTPVKGHAPPVAKK